MTRLSGIAGAAAVALGAWLGATACRDGTAPAGYVPDSSDRFAADWAGPVPFRVDYVIAPQLLVPGDPGFPVRCPTGPNQVATVATGEGTATHLGHVSEAESNCVDFATLTLTQGEFTLTGADGDRVEGVFEGSASFDPPPPSADLACTWAVTGGTGRFTGASGAGVCVDSHQLGDGRSRIRFDGWIRLSASSRARR